MGTKIKAPELPYPPHKWDYEKEFEEKILHRITYVHPEADMDCLVDNYFSDEIDPKDSRDTIAKKLNIENWSYINRIFSVNELLKLIPPGVDLSKVEIRTSRERMPDYIGILVVQLIPIDKKAQKAAYDAAYAAYLKKKAQYDKDLVKYKKFEKEKEIEACERRLKDLKKGE